MRNRIQALATSIAIQPTLEVVSLMGHSEIIGLVHDKGRQLQVHPVRVSAAGDITLDPPEWYYQSALYSRRPPTDEELADLREPLDRMEVFIQHLRDCLGEFNGTPNQLENFTTFVEWRTKPELHAFWDDPSSARPYWDTTSDQWNDGILDPRDPF